jgi:hypothetical protein
VTRQGDRLLFFAPIPPGEKQLATEYILPAGSRETRLVFDQPTPLLNILLAEPEARVAAPGMTLTDTQVIDGRTYRRWTGSVPAGTVVRLSFPAPPQALRWLLPALVAITAGALLLAGAQTFREPALARAAANSAATADGLLTRVATLDAAYRGREATTPPDEWRRYEDERARLKAELSAALAADRR